MPIHEPKPHAVVTLHQLDEAEDPIGVLVRAVEFVESAGGGRVNIARTDTPLPPMDDDARARLRVATQRVPIYTASGTPADDLL